MPILMNHPSPQPNEDQIQHVETYVAARGAAWAREYMAKTGTTDNYPVSEVQLVEREAQTELSHGRMVQEGTVV